MDVIQIENPIGLGSLTAIGLPIGVALGSLLGMTRSAHSRWHCDGDKDSL